MLDTSYKIVSVVFEDEMKYTQFAATHQFVDGIEYYKKCEDALDSFDMLVICGIAADSASDYVKLIVELCRINGKTVVFESVHRHSNSYSRVFKIANPVMLFINTGPEDDMEFIISGYFDRFAAQGLTPVVLSDWHPTNELFGIVSLPDVFQSSMSEKEKIECINQFVVNEVAADESSVLMVCVRHPILEYVEKDDSTLLPLYDTVARIVAKAVGVDYLVACVYADVYTAAQAKNIDNYIAVICGANVDDYIVSHRNVDWLYEFLHAPSSKEVRTVQLDEELVEKRSRNACDLFSKPALPLTEIGLDESFENFRNKLDQARFEYSYI